MDITHEVFAYLDQKLAHPRFLYLVGGSTRDYLLKREFNDFDFATSLTPKEIKPLLGEVKANYAFSEYGIVDFKFQGHPVTLATFRAETMYLDSRHPSLVKFILDPKEDSKRRDFTINAIYLDKNFEILDPQSGLKDLDAKVIRMIGDIPTRIQEDPLRIFRAYRFASSLGFSLEENLSVYLEKHLDLVYSLKQAKVEEELRKFTSEGKEQMLARLGAAGKC